MDDVAGPSSETPFTSVGANLAFHVDGLSPTVRSAGGGLVPASRLAACILATWLNNPTRTLVPNGRRGNCDWMPGESSTRTYLRPPIPIRPANALCSAVLQRRGVFPKSGRGGQLVC